MKIELSPEHVYTVDGRVVPSVTQILGAVGIPDLSSVPVEKLREAQQRGINVHRICELYDRDTLDQSSLDEMGACYLVQWQCARRDLKLKIITENERPVYHRLGYAGTLDRIFNGDTLVDLKTGVSAGVGPQTSAYAEAYKDMTGHRIRKRIAVTLTPDKWSAVTLASATDFNVFLSAFNIYRFKKGV